MSPSPPDRHDGERDQTVRTLLRDLGSRLRRGSQFEELGEAGKVGEGLEQPSGRAAGPRRAAPRLLATGLPQIDDLVGGGFPASRLSEIYGPTSSGRTSVALGLLIQATRAGEVAAVVDPARVFDPASAQLAGADLERLLWVHPGDAVQAARCCHQILEAGGFSLVLWDLAQRASPPIPTASWQKLARAAPSSGTALVVLAGQRTTSSHADLVLEMQAARPHFSGSPALLEGLEIEARVARHRSGPDQRAASVRLDARPGIRRGAA